MKTGRSVHIFAPNTYDSKVSSSLVYEYYKMYSPEVCNFYARSVSNIDDIMTDYNICDNDIVVIIGYAIENMRSLVDIEKMFYKLHGIHIIYITNNELLYDAMMQDDNFDFVKDLSADFSYVIDRHHSLTYLTYMYFAKLTCSEPITDDIIPKNIMYIEQAITNAPNCDQDMIEDFICGINSYNYSLKNAIRDSLNHNGRLNIYENSYEVRHAINKFINRAIKSGKIVRTYLKNITSEIESVFSYKFEIYDETKYITYDCIALSFPGNYTIIMELLKKYDVVFTYRRNENTKMWEYYIFSLDENEDVDCGYIASAFKGYGEKTRGVFTSKKNIFDKFSWMEISQNAFGKIKVYYYK